MSFSTEDRLEFMKRMPDLGPDCDRTAILRFIESRREEALAELVANPGFEQVRAGLLRLLVDLLPSDVERAEILPKIGAVITSPVSAESAADGVFSRHPAWVGLSVLEYCDLVGRDEGALDWAGELACLAFMASGNLNSVGRGEVLWAMAEQAEEIGWFERTSALLEAAVVSDFAEAHHRQQVALIVAMRSIEQKEALLDSVLASEDVDTQTFVHAAWIKAHLLLERDEHDKARKWLGEALEELAGESKSIANRIQTVLDSLPNGEV